MGKDRTLWVPELAQLREKSDTELLTLQTDLRDEWASIESNIRLHTPREGVTEAEEAIWQRRAKDALKRQERGLAAIKGVLAERRATLQERWEAVSELREAVIQLLAGDGDDDEQWDRVAAAVAAVPARLQEATCPGP